MSSKPRKWKFRLKHIIEAISRAESYVLGLSFEAFRQDDKTVDAVVMKLTIIGEAARHVPTEIQEKYPEIPWGKMQGLRNVIVHEYDRINLETVWNVVHQDLPPLVPLLMNVLKQEPGE